MGKDLLLKRLVDDMLEQTYRFPQRRINRIRMYTFIAKNLSELTFVMLWYSNGVSSCSVLWGFQCLNFMKKYTIIPKIDGQ